VVASLLVSVVLLGFKVSALRRLVQVVQRRTELKAALALLQSKFENEALAAFLDGVKHDKVQRECRTGELALPFERVYTQMEKTALEKGAGMYSVFESNSEQATQLAHSLSMRSELNYEEATRRMLGHVEALIQSDPQDVVAYILNYDDSCFAKSEEAANPNIVRFECVAHMNAHHSIGFARQKARGLSDRTFLYSLVASQVAAQPPTHVVVAVPIPSHAKIGEKDEAGAVRGEICKSFRLTELAEGVTKLECSWAVDLKGLVPHTAANTIEAPAHMGYVHSLQRYFQHIKPLTMCDAEDGRNTGQLLLEVVKRAPKDLAHAIRTFTNCTTMLRECGFRHIGVMLVQLLNADAHVGPDKDVANVAPKPSSVTEKQAAAIGSVIASVRLSDMPAVALTSVVESLTVLRAMKSCFVWFIPMLEVLAVPKIAQPRRYSLMKRLTSIATASAPVAPIDAVSDAGIADEGSGFSPVVRPGRNTHATMRTIPRYHVPRTARELGRCLWTRVRARSPPRCSRRPTLPSPKL
jgi:hypothetical protein